ncbi:MAG TPA: class I SAM-dependent methyltransferase [Thermoanaerobaculia bacterium]
MRGIEHIPWLYDATMSLMERGPLGRWRRWLTSNVRGRVLEIGCGTGRNLPLYVEPPVAFDPDLACVRVARSRAPHARLLVASAEALPFRNGAFDTIVSSLVLCSVGDPLAAVRELRRVLAPGGSLRALEHVRGGGFRGRVQDAIQPFWTWLNGGCHPNRDTESTLTRGGFAIGERNADGVMRRLVCRASSQLAV